MTLKWYLLDKLFPIMIRKQEDVGEIVVEFQEVMVEDLVVC